MISLRVVSSLPLILVRHIESYPTSGGDVPTAPIKIAHCGELAPGEDDGIPAPIGGDVYEDFPEDDDNDTQNPEVALRIATEIRELGNTLFKEGKVALALDKYLSEYKLEYQYPYWFKRLK